jgi:hypothetical protein
MVSATHAGKAIPAPTSAQMHESRVADRDAGFSRFGVQRKGWFVTGFRTP